MLGLTGLAPSLAQDKKDKADKDKPKVATVVFEVYKDKAGEFRYRIKDDAGNNNLGGSNKGYDKKEDLLKVLDTIKKGAAAAKIDDQSGAK